MWQPHLLIRKQSYFIASPHINHVYLGVFFGIEGEEIIYHGDDSTPDKIVITPHEEWEISKIIVDGEEIEVTDKDHMVVENFKKVVANHKVQVIFVEKPIPVPITGSKTKFIIASIIIAVMAILAVVKFKVFKKKEI